AVIGAGAGDIRLERSEMLALAALDVEQEELRFARDNQPVLIDPAGGRDALAELPGKFLVAPTRQQLAGENVEPEQLHAQRVPRRALAQQARPLVVDGRAGVHVRASTTAASLS